VQKSYRLCGSFQWLSNKFSCFYWVLMNIITYTVYMNNISTFYFLLFDLWFQNCSQWMIHSQLVKSRWLYLIVICHYADVIDYPALRSWWLIHILMRQSFWEWSTINDWAVPSLLISYIRKNWFLLIYFFVRYYMPVMFIKFKCQLNILWTNANSNSG